MPKIQIKNNIYNKKPIQEEQHGSYPKKWIDRPRYKFLAKFNSSPECFENFGEMLYSHLGKKLGVSCSECAFAKISDNKMKNVHANYYTTNGVVVKDFLPNEDAELIHFDEINILDTIPINYLVSKNEKSKKIQRLACEVQNEKKQLAQTCKHNSYRYFTISNCDMWIKSIQLYCLVNNLKIDISTARTTLYKYAILDIFLMQSDRSLRNIGLIIDGDKAKIAPLYDNGMCMVFFQSPDYSTKGIYNEIIDNRKFIKTKATFSKSKEQLQENFSYLGVDSYDISNDQMTMRKVYSLYKKYSKIKEFVDKLSQINIETEIETLTEIARSEGCSKLPQPAKELTKALFEYISNNFFRYVEFANKLDETKETNKQKENTETKETEFNL